MQLSSDFRNVIQIVVRNFGNLNLVERNLLDVARRWADYLIDEYENGNPYFKNPALKEHSEYELGLLRLYRVTGEKKYLEFSITLTKELCRVGPNVADTSSNDWKKRIATSKFGVVDGFFKTPRAESSSRTIAARSGSVMSRFEC